MQLRGRGPVLISLVAAYLTVQTAAIRTTESSAVDTQNSQPQCKGLRTKRNARISAPPNIGGSWFSPSCELLPGPQYLLRQYEFYRSSSEFVITRYYFSDEFCRKVAYCIQAKGVVTAQSPSWYLSEATDMDMELTDITVKPYTTKMSVILAQIIRGGCAQNKGVNNWTSFPYQAVQLNSSDVRCLQSLSFSANELLVMRQVDYHNPHNDGVDESDGKRRSRRRPNTERELQLGNGVWFSQLDRPSSYQPPLYSITHKHCDACHCLYKANINNPPVKCHVARKLQAVPYNITGNWSSQTCESVPFSLFILRSFKFNDVDLTFNITTHYFTDAFCTQPSFVIRAEGKLVVGKSHPRIYNTRSYELTFERLYVGALSDVMVKLMDLGDSSLCGGVTSWQLGMVYDVTSSRGCNSLGVSISSRPQFVLIKVEQRWSHAQFMQISEMKPNQSHFDTQVTNFSPKLRKCNTGMTHWARAVSVTSAQYSHQRMAAQYGGRGSTNVVSYNLLILSVLVATCSSLVSTSTSTSAT